MVRGSRAALSSVQAGIDKALSDLLETQSLINDELGVSYPIVDGIPCLLPKDGKLLKDKDASKPCNSVSYYPNVIIDGMILAHRLPRQVCQPRDSEA
ncbi:hypothetical protein QJS10_CPB11g02017 [Acorus calamus]|uniref:Uncharacterized protein n=1 Tax=Acorus calamus TaxID=4465 RepID=A0AAV9DRW6_ACOCL|nr:hypothetical protein QJS10_CPB11g02017 [Acorus calamus]